MKKLLLYIVVFFCGGAVLALEILGTRIIGPFYGVSLFLWSALISVTLIALSAGYMIGGRLADKKKSLNTLALLIALPAMYILLLPFFRDFVMGLTGDFGLRTSVIISSFILFFPPLTFLGMVSPYVVKLRTETLEKLGTRAGDLYAVSTIGSVIAALFTGFILIPNIGVVRLTILIGILLLILSSIVFMTGKSIREKTAATVLIIILISSSFYPIGSKIEGGIVEIRNSAYGEIRIMDVNYERLFLIDGGIHSSVNRKNKENVMQYVWVIDIMKNISGHSGDMLLIGLGGGSILKSFYADNWDIEVVEIDPSVTEMAVKYFGVEPGHGTFYHMDGREFLKNSSKKYDLIIMDAFGSSSVPFHLTTIEFFTIVKRNLTQRGFLAINLEAMGWDDIIVKSVAVTLQKCFKNVVVLPIVEPPDKLGNIIITASDESLELKKDLEREYNDPDYRFSAGYERVHAWDNRFTPDLEGIEVLTDDLNPIEIWSERINLQARKELHEYLGEDSFTW
jgi:spermidine synthase